MTSSAALLAAGLTEVPDQRTALVARVDRAVETLEAAITGNKPLRRTELAEIQNVLRDGRAVIAYGKTQSGGSRQ